ncbi:hypothetical protein KGF56_000136 [Candida oxycetoniae]|uniref:AN1-type domain-containing protein n=1 Tax=Candida oxycetoniae TaxID=497107 RepID=A0AAI9T1A5_9ASCO|nr:uncharacterized protein KGF56_000136 [Candida oxycetoniae]KAI3407048.2 hypothetical protein KGF56_000136 [Candida oxycetoniae]
MSVANLFIDKHKRPTKDQGIMDIGKNCFFCSQLDFLPFICEFCKQTFCSSHRTVEKHQCPFKDKFYNQAPNITTTTTTTTIAATPSSNTVSSKTLFPDRAADRRLIDERLNSPKPTTIKETVLKAGAGNKDGVNALGKLQVFLNIQKKNSSTKSISKLFGKSKSSSTIVEMGKLKKEAIGHAKVTASDRIYIWCVYVKESSNMGINDIEQNRKALYVSKNWVIGKSLDSIADCLKISNQNNSTTKEDEKLRIFKLDDSGKPNLIQNSQKSSILKNGDTIYLVRGVV